jgi:hypothetical protein
MEFLVNINRLRSWTFKRNKGRYLHFSWRIIGVAPISEHGFKQYYVVVSNNETNLSYLQKIYQNTVDNEMLMNFYLADEGIWKDWMWEVIGTGDI